MIRHYKHLKYTNQRGVASLLTALVLLISITLVTLLTSKTVLMETKMEANNYRISQAVAAANYAMDYGVNYFDSGGFDQDGDDTIDNIHTHDSNGDSVNDELRLISADSSLTTYATINFDNSAGTLCVPAGATVDMKHGMITAVGFSDDKAATRTVTQCVGPLNIIRDDGPDQPLVAQGNVAVTGNAQIINRYTDTTIWSGDKVDIGNSSAMATYIKSSSAGTLTQAELLDTDSSVNAQLVSNRNLGNGLDIIDDDPSLGTLTGIEFFRNFFTVDTRAELKEIAENIGQSYAAADIDNAVGKSGPIWIEGDASLTSNGTIGSIDSPAIMVINGDFDTAGSPTIYGLLYVTGTYTIGGTVTVIGANVVEGTADTSTNTPATPPIVSGNGTLNLVYWQAFVTGGAKTIPGMTSIIGGSWRDW